MFSKKYFSVCSFLLTRSESAGPGSGLFFQIRIRPEPDNNFFFISRSGRIRISDKNGKIRPDPDPDSESGTSLLLTLIAKQGIQIQDSFIRKTRKPACVNYLTEKQTSTTSADERFCRRSRFREC